MASSKSDYPGIPYCGVVEDWRKSAYADTASLLFVLKDTPRHLTLLMACKALTAKYGDHIFDGMRILHATSELKNDTEYWTTVVEVHFLRNADQRTILSQCSGSSSDQPDKVQHTFVKFPCKTFMIFMTIKTPVPFYRAYSVYTFDGLPLGSFQEKCKVFKMKVIDALFQRRGDLKITTNDIEAKHFVDITPEKVDNKYFVGSVSVVLKNVVKWDIKLQFEAFGKMQRPSNHGTHYLYCSNCQRLDAHYRDSCPFRDQKK